MPGVGVGGERGAQGRGPPGDFRWGPAIVYPPKAQDIAVRLYPSGPKRYTLHSVDVLARSPSNRAPLDKGSGTSN